MNGALSRRLSHRIIRSDLDADVPKATAFGRIDVVNATRRHSSSSSHVGHLKLVSTLVGCDDDSIKRSPSRRLLGRFLSRMFQYRMVEPFQSFFDHFRHIFRDIIYKL